MYSSSRPVIFGLQGLDILSEEREFFAKAKPVGFILFKRNVESKEQVKKLCSNLRAIVGWHCPILIDQEGGRVARLKPPVWEALPALGQLIEKASSEEELSQLLEQHVDMTARQLSELDIDVDCSPVCDLLIDGAHDIIGDRSLGATPELVATRARIMAERFMYHGIMPIIKHIPGHGRAMADSHLELPSVDCDLPTLENTDFKVFAQLADMPWAMTAHIVYNSIDKELPATQSVKAIDYIRHTIGFSGVLVSDDLSMKALAGSFEQRARTSLQAGCDVVLHCNGDMGEMTEVLQGVESMSALSAERFEKAALMLKQAHSQKAA